MSRPPMEDITVIDFTQARAGPWCTQILGELGADIVKIERPGVGDFARDSYPEVGGIGVNYAARNRNKKSVEIDLKTDEGRQVAEDLIESADVLIENFSLGVMERLGLGYEYLSEEVNPELIYASIKGYGEKGPYKDRKGVDLVMQAEGGIMSVTGPEGGPPVKVGQAIGDIGAGLYSVIGITTALHHRERTGEGQKFETNLFGTIVSFMEEYITKYGITGEDPTPYGTRHQTTIPYELFETADGEIVISIGRQWDAFVEEYLEDDRLLEWQTSEEKQKHYEDIMEVMRPVIKSKTTAEWEEIFDELGCPYGRLNKVSDVVEHPQAQARDHVFEYSDPELGDMLLHGHPLEFSETSREIRSGPPQLGEHTEEVLRDYLDKSDEQIKALRALEAIPDREDE